MARSTSGRRQKPSTRRWRRWPSRSRCRPARRRDITLLLAWHFPNRYTWQPRGQPPGPDDRVGNFYTTRYRDAWDVVDREVPRLDDLRQRTLRFVRAFADSALPPEVKEAALCNLSTLRTQTCFRTADGRFFGFEGSNNHSGCCWGSCTHVWNYEQATAFLFGSLAWSMREIEFAHATDAAGLMSFRVQLPIERAQGVRQGRSRWPDGLRDEGLPRLAPVG